MTHAEILNKMPSLLVLNNDDCPELNALASRLGVPVVAQLESDENLYLFHKEGNLTLGYHCHADTFEIHVDFQSGEITHRLKQGHGKHQPLAKAIGLNKMASLSVIDATAGLGRDAFVLASLDCKVTMLERSPVVSALLMDGIKRAQENESISFIANKMQLVHEDARDFLRRCDQNADVVYLDPMFPERKKSAKVKKEMQILQYLLGHDLDDIALLDAALSCAKRRVVVKRPKGAGWYCNRPPTHVIESKKMRYDVYMCTKN